MHKQRFRLGNRKYFFTKRAAVKPRLPKDVVKSPFLEVFKRLVDVALKDMV